jgi:hypothetical protein
MLALWAARRHDVPVERLSELVNRRFRTGQQPTGGWGYHYKSTPTQSMTCVGLIGLAIGHGTAHEVEGPRKGPSLTDPAIEKGLQALGKFVGAPKRGKGSTPMVSLYFLWSVERVGVLYDLKTIGGKDWYTWGVEMLLPNQKADGSWVSPAHGGPVIDTSMALLFLRRANLTTDLSRSLRMFMAISDPDARGRP